MKGYWILGATFLLPVWPLGANAISYAGMQDERPPTHLQASSPAASAQQNADVKLAEPNTAAAVAPASSQPKTSFLLVELTRSLKAKKLKPGDKIKASVTQDVVSHGKVIIPVETRLVGHVTEVSVRDHGNPESRLGIIFDRILLKQFHEIAFNAVVQAVAPPALRPSRVDQPSQMLPPSMVGGERQSTSMAMGRSSSSPAPNRGQVSSSTASSAIGSGDITNIQAPLTVRQSAATNASLGASGALLGTSSGGTPLSLGMPQGVRGLKGLSLSPVPSDSTPGPVIVSSTGNVKLESGTQILLRVINVEMPVKRP